MSREEQSQTQAKTRSEVSGLVKALRFRLVDENVSAVARLLYQQAPYTCDVVVAALPHSGEAFHAEHSGQELFTVLPGRIHAPAENRTLQVNERDVGFLRFRGGTDVVPDDKVASEIAWFYGDQAVPSMKDGPVPLNIFARFELDGWAEFVAACRTVEPAEARPLVIEPVED